MQPQAKPEADAGQCFGVNPLGFQYIRATLFAQPRPKLAEGERLERAKSGRSDMILAPKSEYTRDTRVAL